MILEDKYKEVKEIIGNNYKEVVLQPNYFGNKVRTKGEYLERLNNVFLGVHEENERGSKYIITVFLQDFFSKDWVRELLFIDKNFNLINVRTTKSIRTA